MPESPCLCGSFYRLCIPRQRLFSNSFQVVGIRSGRAYTTKRIFVNVLTVVVGLRRIIGSRNDSREAGHWTTRGECGRLLELARELLRYFMTRKLFPVENVEHLFFFVEHSGLGGSGADPSRPAKEAADLTHLFCFSDKNLSCIKNDPVPGCEKSSIPENLSSPQSSSINDCGENLSSICTVLSSRPLTKLKT